MVSASASNQKVFGSPEQVLAAGVTIRRLNTLYTHLEKEGVRRDGVLKEITAIWQEALKNLRAGMPHIDVMKIASQSFLVAVHADSYREELSQVKSADDLDRCLVRFIKDRDSLQAPPMVRSAVGNNGPTFLVRYLREKNEGNSVALKRYVMKWVGPEEVYGHLLYKKLCAAIFKNSTFVVPKAHAIDFKESAHMTLDGERLPISPELIGQFRATLLPFSKGVDNPKSIAMFMKYVSGENVADFVGSGKFQALRVEQKCELFSLMGGLALLDVILGNTDRLSQIGRVNGSYIYDNFGSNIGNLMIQWDSNTYPHPRIHVIDNGLDGDLVYGDEKNSKELYNHFLASQLGDENFVLNLARNVLLNLSEGAKTATEGLKEEDREKKTNLLQFSQSLCKGQKMLESALARGISKTAKYIQNRLFPLLYSEGERVDLMKGVSEPIIAAVSERLSIFKEHQQSLKHGIEKTAAYLHMRDRVLPLFRSRVSHPPNQPNEQKEPI